MHAHPRGLPALAVVVVLMTVVNILRTDNRELLLAGSGKGRHRLRIISTGPVAAFSELVASLFVS